MKKWSWPIIVGCFLALTLLIVFSRQANSAGNSSSSLATDTRWPTSTRRPSDTRWPTFTIRPTDTHWPTRPTATRWPTVTRRPTDTRWPTLTLRPTDTRWPVLPTSTRWPTITRPPTDTRWPTLTSRPTATRWPTIIPSPTNTRWPSATLPLLPSLTPTPTTAAAWLHYTNATYGVEFYYPPDTEITVQEDDHVQMYFSVTPGTNLVSKYLEFYINDASEGCPAHFAGDSAGYQIFNGYRFQLGTGGDAGAGQLHEWTTYSTQQGNICISFTFILHSANLGALPPGTPAFDKAAESALFPQIVNTFRLLTSATATPSGLTMGPFGVVEVQANDVLNIRSGPGASYSIIGSFPYNAANIMRSGSIQPVGGATWYRVQNPSGGTGWVNSYYLSEYVLPATFCSDARVQSLIVQLQQAVNDSNGLLFASLVSPLHGVDVRDWHAAAPINYSSAQAGGAFTNATQQNWGSGPSGNPTIGTFSDVIQPQLADVLNAFYESYCDDPKTAATYAEPWPAAYTNFNYYSLFKPGTPGVDLDYNQWMVGIEYVYGRPYIMALTHVVWEP